MQNKLVRSWSVFIVFLIMFVFGVEMYHKAHSDATTAFRCKIMISKDLIIDDTEEKKEKKSKKQENLLYENSEYGWLPVITMNGETVYDRYSAKVDCDKFVRLAVSLENETIDDVIKFLSKLENNKISFIVPTYIDNFKNIVSTIVEHGHEVFLLLPTQQLVSDKQNVVPFLANSDPKETREKLLRLIASSHSVIGVANISSSLVVQSAKDMNVIILELAKRGMAFFDANLLSPVLDSIAEKTGIVYLHLDEVYTGKTKQLNIFATYYVPMKKVYAFMKLLPQKVGLAPISQEIKE